MKRNIALVLSSGGARGLAHIGVIEELEKAGFNITSIAGSSIGALIGGIYATGNLKEFKEWVSRFSRMDMIRMMDFAISKRGFIKGERVFREIRNFIGDKRIEDLPIPYAAIAADIEKHREVVFESGSLVDAIRASVSIPTIFFPWKVNDTVLIDGGMINPLPLNRVKRTDGDLLVAVNLNAAIPYIKPADLENEKKVHNRFAKAKQNLNRRWNKFFLNGKEASEKRTGFFDLLTGSFALMQDKISEYERERYRPDILLEISRHASDTLEFYKAKEMIEAGRMAFDRYKKSLHQEASE
ncbi:MAG: patatin-like phospholipase family protein [Bacteroidales bacterium]|nr:patatin-like phospholipase family protein [Bacteroidales bacterium]MCF8344536.1 patatin-like phospholipase family protein [Bacteroidales bacterium]MCF8352522.1 patatin-like phospholipase family protein [Bacteroidales bacterium]MCF8377811.1 patatin-like phospholipase family protein [Bacteroidales bacterium]